MTVSTEVDHNDYTGNGVTTSFPYTFRIFKKSDLTVQVADLNENITVLTLDTDYSVTGAGTYSGGNVVLMSPLANGWQISISRDLPVTQETDLRNQGKFFAEVHEDAFDKLTMLIQQCFSFLRLALRKPSFIANYYDALNNRIRNLRDPSQAQDAATKNYVDGQIVDNTNAWKAGDAVLDQKIDANFKKSLRIPESYIGALPSVEMRKNKIIAMDNNGNPLMVLPESGSAADVMIEYAKPSGSGNIGVLTGGTVEDAIKYVTPEMMRVNGERYIHGVTSDATKFLQAAIDYGKDNSLPVYLSKMYPCISSPIEFNLPFDDGTVYPGWIGNGDSNIAPETPVKAKASLRVYDDSIIVGENQHTCGIIGNFSKTAGPWNHTSAMGLYVAGDSGPDQYIKYHFSDFRISGFFIGQWVDGTVNRCVENNMMYSGCAIPACYQGSDSLAQTGLTLYWYNITGPVFGGRWLTRNHAYASQYLPPYPASDIHRAGWNDSYHVEKFHYYGDTGMNWTHPAYAALDSWFDTYVFKSANCLPTASGGRLSNNQQPGVYPVDTYKGVSGRARTIFSLPGREILHCNIQEAKVLWSPRTPFHQSAQFVAGFKSYVGNSKIKTAIIERVGIINYSAGDVPGNRFNVDNVDPYDSSQTTFPAMVTRGNIFAMDVVKGGAVQTAPVNEFTGTRIGAGENIVSQRKLGDTANYRLFGLQELNGTNLSDKYVFNRNDAYMPPISFPGGNAAQFKYLYGSFTPTITIGGSSVTPSSITGVYRRFGDVVRCDIRVRSTSLLISTAGAIVISGLPFVAASIQEGSSKGSVILSTATSVFVMPLVTAGTNQVTIIKSSAQELYSQAAGTFDFTLQCTFDYVVPFNS